MSSIPKPTYPGGSAHRSPSRPSGICNWAALSGKCCTQSHCSGVSLLSKPNIVVQFRMAAEQFSGLISTAPPFLPDIPPAKHIGFTDRRERFHYPVDTTFLIDTIVIMLERPEGQTRLLTRATALSWFAGWRLWSHALWHSSKQHLFSTHSWQIQHAISGAKYQGRCSISTCLFTENTSWPQRGHFWLLPHVPGGTCPPLCTSDEERPTTGASTAVPRGTCPSLCTSNEVVSTTGTTAGVVAIRAWVRGPIWPSPDTPRDYNSPPEHPTQELLDSMADPSDAPYGLRMTQFQTPS